MLASGVDEHYELSDSWVRSEILATKRGPFFRFTLSRLLSVNDSTFPDYVEKSHEFPLGVFNSPRYTLCAASGAINAAARSGISSWCDCVGIHLTPSWSGQ